MKANVSLILGKQFRPKENVMPTQTLCRYIVCAAFALIAVFSWSASKAQAQRGGELTCQNNWYNGRLVSHCEIKEQTLPAVSGTLSVDARQNGGIRIRGWDRNEMLLRMRVQAAAATQAEADDLAKRITVETDGGQIRADGPSLERNRFWDVSYEIFVPRHSDLSLESYNGGISISDVSGRIEFEAHNGGVSLDNLGGDVQGRTINGGLSVNLTGARWDGDQLDVETTNGGISLRIPDNYSAHLETGTVNGSFTLGFPVTLQGRISTKHVSLDLGGGGSTVRVMTTNGGVVVKGAKEE
jgi:hypothetical protein